MKYFLILFVILSFLLIACSDDIINIPKICAEEPDFNITYVTMVLATDTTIQKNFDVSSTGYFSCQNISVKKYGVLKNINIYGAICKNYNMEMYITYNDTNDNSKLKAIASKYNSENYSGYVYYCSNENDTCDYIQIGNILGSISSSGVAGTFYTPKFTGSFTASIQ